jgi:non-heme chloroperoxidase
MTSPQARPAATRKKNRPEDQAHPRSGLAPVLMIHGAFCGPWSLLGLKERFEKAGYSVAAPALRFHDQNPPPAALATTGLADYAADLRQEIKGLGQAPILVGHSMGGLLAMMLASRTKVAAHLHPGYWNQILEPNRDVALAHSLDRLPRHMRDEVYGQFVPESGRATFEIMNWGLDLNCASAVDADAVAAPLLFLTGSEDRINPPSTVARVAALFKGRANAQVLEGMGHWLIGEPGWERLADRALDWLKKTRPSN